VREFERIVWPRSRDAVTWVGPLKAAEAYLLGFCQIWVNVVGTPHRTPHSHPEALQAAAHASAIEGKANQLNLISDLPKCDDVEVFRRGVGLEVIYRHTPILNSWAGIVVGHLQYLGNEMRGLVGHGGSYLTLMKLPLRFLKYMTAVQ
jgi:hypothetical protein